MEEDQQTNQMKDGLALFGSIVNNKAFKKTTFILFMNKMDIFEEKIKHSNIKDYFEDYDGNFKNKPLSLNEYFR